MPRPLRLIDASFPDEPGVDTALSRQILADVGSGVSIESLRLHRPGRIVAFGRQDVMSPGYRAAVTASSTRGYLPVERLAGGRAAIFHEDTIAFSWASPSDEPKAGITRRFETLCTIMVDAFAGLGLDARIGEIEGEYCPGRYSINIAGRRKILGVGQRLIRGAAHVGGVIVVDGRDRVNDILDPVYRALALEWSPDATGDIAEYAPDATWQAVADAITDEFGRRFDIVPEAIPAATVEAARALAPEHLSAG